MTSWGESPSKMYLGRSLTELEKRGIGFKSLQEQIDTTSSSGKLVLYLELVVLLLTMYAENAAYNGKMSLTVFHIKLIAITTILVDHFVFDLLSQVPFLLVIQSKWRYYKNIYVW
jgi:hypothetical protein